MPTHDVPQIVGDPFHGHAWRQRHAAAEIDRSSLAFEDLADLPLPPRGGRDRATLTLELDDEPTRHSPLPPPRIMRSTRHPFSASAAPRLMVVVVYLHPALLVTDRDDARGTMLRAGVPGKGTRARVAPWAQW